MHINTTTKEMHRERMSEMKKKKAQTKYKGGNSSTGFLLEKHHQQFSEMTKKHFTIH